jgi:RNA polymerase sigma-70 factor, ECF subfamily
MAEARLVSEGVLPIAGEARPAAGARFVEALSAHQSLVFSLAYHLLRNAAWAEEVAQDVFLRLYRDLDRIDGPAHLVHWLRRTTTHRCLDLLRRSAHRRQVSLEEAEEAVLSAPQPAEADPLVARDVRRLVSQLPPSARAVIVLRYQEDLDPREIARVLDLPVNTVKSRLQRALTVLRGRFASLEESRHA